MKLLALVLGLSALAPSLAHASDSWKVIPANKWEVVEGAEAEAVRESVFRAINQTQFTGCTMKSIVDSDGAQKIEFYVPGNKTLQGYVRNASGWVVARRMSPQPSIQLGTNGYSAVNVEEESPGTYLRIATDKEGRKITKLEFLHLTREASDSIAYGAKPGPLKRSSAATCVAK